MKPPLTPMASLRYDRARALVPPGVQSVLEIGCGQGAVGYRLATGAAGRSYLGLEPDEQSAAVARQRLQGVPGATIRAASTAVLDDTAQFDLVCAFEVLEHIADDKEAVNEWVRHVRPGGHLLVSVPAHPERFGAADEAVGHYRRYDAPGLRELLAGAGLADLRLVFYGMPLGYLLARAENVLLARHGHDSPSGSDGTREDRSSGSGRVLQPAAPWVGAVIAVGTAPFRWMQRPFPRRGIGLLARGRVPAA